MKAMAAQRLSFKIDKNTIVHDMETSFWEHSVKTSVLLHFPQNTEVKKH